MANLVDQIKRKLPNECLKKGKLTKEGCAVSLKGAPRPSIKIDMDNKKAPVGQNETKCDYIFIGGCDDVVLAPLELTKQDLNASKIVRQLRAGADIAATRIIPKGEQVQFQPVAFCDGKIHPDQRQRLAQSKIRFNNQNANVRLLRCGQRLIDAPPKER